MTLIAIVDKKWGLAKDGKQIARIQEDLLFFRLATMGRAVVMGRKTFEAIGGPLDGRRNIVLSASMPLVQGAEVVRGLDELPPLEDACLIGGESVYRHLLHMCRKACITQVDADLGADQFLPDLDALPHWIRRRPVTQLHSRGMRYRRMIYDYRPEIDG